jgi:hypothetical protein
MTDQELKDLVASLAVHSEEDRKKSSEAREKFDRGMEEVRLAQAKTARLIEETAQQMKETDRKLKDMGVLVGGISNNNGYYSENFFQDAFERKMEFGGIKYDRMIANFGRNDEEAKMEIDIVLINGDSLALIEAKYRIHPDYVAELAQERVKKFRTLYPKYNDYKVYLGIAGFSFEDKVLAEAKKFGVGIVKPVGEEVEIETGDLKVY